VRTLGWLRGWAARLLADRRAVAWMVFVAFVYAGATFVRSQASAPWGPDHMMILARDITQGRFDLSSLTTITTSSRSMAATTRP
jgi:hypothetical protein